MVDQASQDGHDNIMIRRLSLTALLVLSLAPFTWPDDNGIITVTKYDFADYRRHPRMEEEDRFRDLSFKWSPGLEIITDIDDVEVWISGEKVGRTPWEKNNIKAGSHRIKLVRSGFEIVSFEVIVQKNKRNVVEVVMRPAKGTLVLEGLPENVEVSLDRVPVYGDTVQFQPGPRTLDVRAFGWEPIQTIIDIKAGEEITWKFEGIRSKFTLTALEVSPQSLPVWDSRGFQIHWRASAAGQGSLKIIRPDGRHAANWPITFDSSSGHQIWIPLDNPELLPGNYQVILTGRGNDGAESKTETELVLDNRFNRQARSMASALPGLRFAWSTAMLPPGVWQIATGAGTYIDSSQDGAANGFPTHLGFRASVAPRWEIGLNFTITAREPLDTTSLTLSAYGAFRIIPNSGAFSANLLLDFVYLGQLGKLHRIPKGNPTESLPGPALTLPMEYSIGRLSFVVAPQGYLFFSGPHADSPGFAPPARLAGSLAGGIYYEGNRFLIGASTLLRSPDIAGEVLSWTLWSGLDGRIDLSGGTSYLSFHPGIRYLQGDPVLFLTLEFGIIG